jgi:hypothetical protein
VAVLVLLLASVGLVLAGLVCQVVFKDTDGTRDYQQVYPWLYFLAAWAPLALALRWLCWRLYTVRGPGLQDRCRTDAFLGRDEQQFSFCMRASRRADVKWS